VDVAATLEQVRAEFGIIDLHVDFVLQARLFAYDPRVKHPAGRLGQPMFHHCDVPRLVEADHRAVFLGVHGLPFEREFVWRETLRQIDYIATLANDERCLAACVSTPFEPAPGRVSLFVGVEGAHQLAGRLERVEQLARRGVSYVTLCHLGPSSAARPSWGWRANDHAPLTGWGRELVAELERTGILVDVAHASIRAALDACAAAKRPVLCTHTGARSLSGHKRLVTDEVLDAVASTGGVVGVIYAPAFLAGDKRADSSCVADHIEYIARRVGVAHVALGSDYDGWLPAIPSDQRDCRDAWNIARILLERGWSAADVGAVCAGNVRRLVDGSVVALQAPRDLAR
jgi:membrane dipeptidase